MSFVLLDDNEKNIKNFSNFLSQKFSNFNFEVINKLDFNKFELKFNNDQNILFINYQFENLNILEIMNFISNLKRKIFVFIISNNFNDINNENLISLGIDDIFIKPFDFEVIETKINSIIQNKFVSSLSFFSKSFPLAKAKFSLKAELLEINEEKATLLIPYLISVGAYFDLKINNLKIPVKVINNYQENNNFYILNLLILDDFIDKFQKQLLRKTIYERSIYEKN